MLDLLARFCLRFDRLVLVSGWVRFNRKGLGLRFHRLFPRYGRVDADENLEFTVARGESFPNRIGFGVVKRLGFFSCTAFWLLLVSSRSWEADGRGGDDGLESTAINAPPVSLSHGPRGSSPCFQSSSFDFPFS